MKTIDVTINIQSIDAVLSAAERETFRGYVAECLRAEHGGAVVTVNVLAAESRSYVDGARSYEIERRINDAFDAFCS